MHRWLPFVLLTFLAPGLWAGVDALASRGCGHENRNGSRDPSGYVDGYSMYSGYFAPNGVDSTGEWAIWTPVTVSATGTTIDVMKQEVRDRINGALDGVILKAARLAGEADKLIRGLELEKKKNPCLDFTCLTRNLRAVKDTFENVIDGIRSSDHLGIYVEAAIPDYIFGSDAQAYTFSWALGDSMHFTKSGWDTSGEEFDVLLFHELTHIKRKLHPGLETDDGESGNPFRNAHEISGWTTIESSPFYGLWKTLAEHPEYKVEEKQRCSTSGLPSKYLK